MLAEVVVTVNRVPAEVAHEGAAAARHPVAALGLHQACGTLVALPDTGSGHLFLTGHETNDIRVQFTDTTQTSEDLIAVLAQVCIVCAIKSHK